ncbi:hypothetical protein Fcan01_19262 [Folsomia candida]|uniref:Uncharacterized protein n=1 Tax=Folsomia candida TaxID=158441 RepID=A0A226DLB5_FOLCA|nr:hypothetical protein Fcan01_19262 [Folsomia candida]
MSQLSVPHPPAEVKTATVRSKPESLFRHFIREYSACGISLKAAAYWVAILGIILFSSFVLVTSYFYLFGERDAYVENSIVVAREKNTTSSISEGFMIFGIVLSVILALIHVSLLAGIHQSQTANFEAITGCWKTMVAFFSVYFGLMIFAHVMEGKNLYIPKEEVFITLSSFYGIWLVGCFRVELKVKMEAEKSNNDDNHVDTVEIIVKIIEK